MPSQDGPGGAPESYSADEALAATAENPLEAHQYGCEVKTPTKPTPAEVLALELPPNDFGATTVSGYLIELLRVVWREEQGFSGKRPFGNSGWQHDIYKPLVKAGWVEGRLDEDGYLERVDERAADALIDEAIQAIGQVIARLLAVWRHRDDGGARGELQLFRDLWAERDRLRVGAETLRDELNRTGAKLRRVLAERDELRRRLDSGPVTVAEFVELAETGRRVAVELIEVIAERDAMRPVVEAAVAWADSDAASASHLRDTLEDLALVVAVDAYTAQTPGVDTGTSEARTAGSGDR